MKIGLDTSVIVPLINKAHYRHAAAFAAYNSLRAAQAELVLTDHAILESFSVLSRAPEPIGVPPPEAEQSLREIFGSATVAPLRSGAAWDAIRLTLTRGYWGGRVYETAIALATFEAGARVLLTWNVKDFISIAPAGLEVREP